MSKCRCPCHKNEQIPACSVCYPAHDLDEPPDPPHTLVPINTSLDWVVDTMEITDNEGEKVERTFIFPPARWSIRSYGPDQAGFLYHIEQRAIPAESGVSRLAFERHEDEEDATEAAKVASDPGFR